MGHRDTPQAVDVVEPPAEPPDDCHTPIMWAIARQMWTDHARGTDGLCTTCHPATPTPCQPRLLAVVGFQLACIPPADWLTVDPSAAAWREVIRSRVIASAEQLAAAGWAAWTHIERRRRTDGEAAAL